MSLQPVIPRRVALQQSSLPLHRLAAIVLQKVGRVEEFPVNGNCRISSVSHPRGSPHLFLVSNLLDWSDSGWGGWVRTGLDIVTAIKNISQSHGNRRYERWRAGFVNGSRGSLMVSIGWYGELIRR